MREKMSIEDFRSEYDWGGAFDSAMGAVYEASSQPDPLPGFGGPVAWVLGDVAEVLASDEGENDERNWVALLRLTDGRVVFMSAGCGYTGWDCQAGGRSVVGDSVDAMVKLGMTIEERERLRVPGGAA